MGWNILERCLKELMSHTIQKNAIKTIKNTYILEIHKAQNAF